MLLAVEGGGFFSSSASGYSKGLTLLLLGRKHEDNKPMRVTPWNQYQLVDQEPDPDLQLASFKNWFFRGCASFACFGCASAGTDNPSPLKVGPTRQPDVLPNPFVDDKGGDCTTEGKDENSVRKVSLKSSLRKAPNRNSVPAGDGNRYSVAPSGNYCDISGQSDQRKVQWTDVHGSELVQIREFEPSETCGSDNEADGHGERSCSCAIM